MSSTLKELQKVDPPVPNIAQQQYTNVSFMLSPEPRILKSGKPLYGFYKLRGSHSTFDLAEKDAIRIIKEIDSKFLIRHIPTGRWFPITEDPSVMGEITDVADREHQLPNSKGELSSLRDQAAKDKQASDAKIMRELREKERDLRENNDEPNDPESLTYYAIKRVTEMKLTEEIEILKKKLHMMSDKRVEVWTELRVLECNNPDYTDQWIDTYNVQRSKTGIPDFVPSATVFDEYNAFVHPPQTEYE